MILFVCLFVRFCVSSGMVRSFLWYFLSVLHFNDCIMLVFVKRLAFGYVHIMVETFLQ